MFFFIISCLESGLKIRKASSVEVKKSLKFSLTPSEDEYLQGIDLNILGGVESSLDHIPYESYALYKICDKKNHCVNMRSNEVIETIPKQPQSFSKVLKHTHIHPI